MRLFLGIKKLGSDHFKFVVKFIGLGFILLSCGWFIID